MLDKCGCHVKMIVECGYRVKDILMLVVMLRETFFIIHGGLLMDVARCFMIARGC